MDMVEESPDYMPKVKEALGASLGLLGTFLGAMLFAYLLPRLSVYVTFLMPILVGFILAALGSMGPRYFGFGRPLTLLLLMLTGTLVVWFGQHMFAYLNLVNYMASEIDTTLVDAAASPLQAAAQWLEESTGERGYWAYLAFVSKGDAAIYSPIGLLGELELSPFWTITVAIVEYFLMLATASWSILYRTRHLRSPKEKALKEALPEAIK